MTVAARLTRNINPTLLLIIFDAKCLQCLLVDADGIALTILGGLNNYIGDNLSTADPKYRSDLQALSKASPIAKVAASSRIQTFWIGMIFIGTSRKKTSGSAGASLSHRGPKLFR